jgi:hypothetical protein
VWALAMNCQVGANSTAGCGPASPTRGSGHCQDNPSPDRFRTKTGALNVLAATYHVLAFYDEADNNLAYEAEVEFRKKKERLLQLVRRDPSAAATKSLCECLIRDLHER